MDLKIGSAHFYRFIKGISSYDKEVETTQEGSEEKVVTIEKVLDVEKYFNLIGIFEKAFSGQPPFLGDLENETYKMILAKLREFNPAAA
jgi:hypothetical protein